MLKVIGLGNILKGDDGIGPVVVRELINADKLLQIKPLDVGADAFTLLDHLLGPEPVLIIDCARMGKKPGTVQLIRAEDTRFLKANLGISLHGFSLAEIWQVARLMGVKNRLSVVGIEPYNLNINCGLSEMIKKTIPIILQMIAKEAEKYAEKDYHH